MKWIIEFINGNQIVEDKINFKLIEKNNFKKIYFFDGKNQYGFYSNGKFFINNQTFDFKIKIADYELIPFQNKTGMLLFNQNNQKNDIFSWNIGYKLKNNEKIYEYKMIILKNKEIYFEALEFNLNNEIINNKKIKLL